METTIVRTEDEPKLILNSKFEKLSAELNKEREEVLASELNKSRMRDILKSIASVYYFLRCTYGISQRDLALEEFEVAEAYLKEVASQKTSSRWGSLLYAVGWLTLWRYYLVYGYFHAASFPNFSPNFGLEVNSKTWRHSHPWYNCYDTFDPLRPIDHRTDYSNYFAIPPNIIDLSGKIFNKRFRST